MSHARIRSQLSQAQAFVTLDGSTIRELAGPVSIPAEKQSLAEATVRVGDEQRDVRAGECVAIPPGTIHKLTNSGDVPIRLLCCCAPPYSDADTVLTGG